MWALMWNWAQISPGRLTGRHLAFKYCLAPTIVITLSLEPGRFRQILSDRLKLTGKFRRVKVRLRAVKSFMELKFMRSKNIFCSHLGFRAPLLCTQLNYWSSCNSYLEYRLIILLMLYCYNQLVECLACCAHSPGSGSSEWEGGERGRGS